MASGKPLLCRGLGLGVYSTAQLRTKMENKNDWFNHTRTAQHAEVGANAYSPPNYIIYLWSGVIMDRIYNLLLAVNRAGRLRQFSRQLKIGVMPKNCHLLSCHIATNFFNTFTLS